jgi:hypothetical protein
MRFTEAADSNPTITGRSHPADEITLHDSIIVFGFKREGDWWYGESEGHIGWFPATYCEPATEVNISISKGASPTKSLTPDNTPKNGA